MYCSKLNWYSWSKHWLIVVLIGTLLSGCDQKIEQIYPSKSVSLEDAQASEIARQITEEVSLEIADGLEVQLWAGDTLVEDPIAISVDEQGRIFFTSGTRLANSEFDIRSHRNWMTASISFQSVEDRRAFLRETFAEQNEEGERFLKDLNEDGTLDWKDLTVEKEQVWFVEDVSGDGYADRSQMYLEDFNEEITDLANGVEAHNGEVFISVGPDLWRTQDRDKDGIADQVTSISHGFAVHIGFGAHGMSGAKVGPDGRIWWGIGDIGMNVVDQDGKRWKYPNRGVIVRAEYDGSGFEVYSSGVRNTHEFAFDKYGNLISVDNDGDHQGERERLVHLINGSETGWRINWQFGKYTDPDNNSYKVWMDEKLHVPHWEGQAAYILPPIQNYVNGPTGLVYNPGTALNESYYDHFFVAEFRGTPALSPVHAFSLKPEGASFVLDETQQLVKGILPTGLDFGPEGALYIGDWIDGWDTNDGGRIWKMDVPGGANTELRQQTKAIIQTDFNESNLDQLQEYLKHQDMRIRQKAQFELVTRGGKGLKALNDAIAQDHQLARVHGIWGIGQMARSQKLSNAATLLPLLQDGDDEIAAQAAKILGDVKYPEAGEALVPLLAHPSLRVQLYACEALGRIEYQPAVEPIIELVRRNNDQDLWLRHAAMIALGRIGDVSAMVALKDSPSKALKTVAVVALRRMNSPQVSEFLQDQDEFIVTEAARAINDDFSIEAALPALAAVLADTMYSSEPLVRRAISANLRVGGVESSKRLQDYVMSTIAPAAMRAEALDALSGWGKPSVFDRVDGRYRGVVERDDALVKAQLSEVMTTLLETDEDLVQIAAAKAAGKLGITSTEAALLTAITSDQNAKVRQSSLEALFKLGAPSLNRALELAFTDSDQQVRSAALTIVPQSDILPDQAVALFQKILNKGTYQEKQAAIASLGTLKVPAAVAVLNTYLDRLRNGRVDPEIRLDVLEASKAQGDAGLASKVEAYERGKSQDDPLSPFLETLAGGNASSGGRIFYENEAAQCVRCHTVFEVGGTAGPGLAGVADRLSPIQLLTAVVAPSAQYAAGYEVVTLNLNDDSNITGVAMEETADSLRLKLGNSGFQTIAKSDISSRRSVPSSMPPMDAILSKSEVRDVVAYLQGLKSEE